MSVTPAVFSRLPAEGAQFNPAPLVPLGGFETIEEYGYVHEEWLISGEADGHPYTSTIYVRRPTDPARCSGTLILEPLHGTSYAPIYAYCARYILRSGHAWAGVTSLKMVLDSFVKPANTDRYASTEIWSDVQPPAAAGRGLRDMQNADPEAMRARMEWMEKANGVSTIILAQVGAAIAGGVDAYPGLDIRSLVLVGHSHTGGVVTHYIRNGHDQLRHADGKPVYHGFFPSGAPGVQFGPRDVPIVQTLSEGDISNPNRPGREGRGYRRDDSDDGGDRYRLYEIAGIAHLDTRYPPSNDAAFWSDPNNAFGSAIPEGARMNSLSQNALFSVTLDHLVQWSANGKTSPKADRLEVGPNGLFVKDEFGNSKGGVRCAQMDVPRNKYQGNLGIDENGVPVGGVVGIEETLPKETLQELYRDHFDYVEQFNRRVDETIEQGWLLPEDADEMRAEADKAEVP